MPIEEKPTILEFVYKPKDPNEESIEITYNPNNKGFINLKQFSMNDAGQQVSIDLLVEIVDFLRAKRVVTGSVPTSRTDAPQTRTVSTSPASGGLVPPSIQKKGGPEPVLEFKKGGPDTSSQTLSDEVIFSSNVDPIASFDITSEESEKKVQEVKQEVVVPQTPPEATQASSEEFPDRPVIRSKKIESDDPEEAVKAQQEYDAQRQTNTGKTIKRAEE